MYSFIIKSLFFIVILTFYAFGINAQNRLESKENLTIELKTEIVHNNVELNSQLSEKFGQDYSLTDKNVMNQLKANIVDKNLSSDIRKSSLYLYYGEEYTKYLYLIKNEESIKIPILKH